MNFPVISLGCLRKIHLSLSKWILLILPVSFIFSNPIQAETEPNNSYTQASTLAVNSSDNASSGSGDTDWFKIILSTDGKLTVNVSCTSPLQVNNIAIYASDGATQLASGSWGATASVTHNSLIAGTYYIYVPNYIGTTGNYTIQNSFTAASLNNDTEPNNDINSALVISPNSSLNGRLNYTSNGTYDQTDWYKVTLPSDGSLKFILTGESSLQVNNIILYDQDKTTSLVTGSWGTNASVEHTGLGQGTYYLKIPYYSGYGSYTIQNIFTPALYTNDTEPNDSAGAASVLPVNDSVSGRINFYSLGKNDQVDYYKITLPDDGKLIVNVNCAGNLQVNNVNLYDPDKSTSLITGSWGAKAGFTYNNLGKGTYYIKVPYYTNAGSYYISSRFTPASLPNDTEPNNKASQAMLLALDDTVTGRLYYYKNKINDMEDWYKVSLPTGGNLNVYVKGAGGLRVDNIRLFDKDTIQIFSGSWGENASLSANNLSKGTYFIRVPYYTGYDSYTLWTSYTPAPTADFSYRQNMFSFDFTNHSLKATSYLWNFDDGTTSTYENPFHVYQLPGVYNVSLIAFNAAGTDTMTKTVSIRGINSIRANHAGNGGDATIYAYGAGFTKQTTFKLSRNGYPDIDGDTVVLETIGSIRTTFDLRNKQEGYWNVVIDVPVDTTMILPNGFKIEATVPAMPWIDVLGRDRILFNKWQTFTIHYGNNGNVDALGVPFWLVVSDVPGLSLSLENFNIELPKMAYENNWTILKDSVPIFYTTDKISGENFPARVYPLYIPRIPAGANKSIKIKIKTPQDVQIMAWINSSLYHSPMDPRLSDCLFWANSKAVANSAIGNIPGFNCAYSVMNHFYDPFEYPMPEENQPKETWGSFLWGWASTGLTCVSNFVPGSAALTNLAITTFGTAMDFVDGKNSIDACYDAFGENSKKNKRVRAVSSFDPNEIVGPKGYTNQNYILRNNTIPYTIFFENKSTATAPAQEVIVGDTLDKEKFDFRSFSFGSFGFGDTSMTPLPGQKQLFYQIDLRPKKNCIVQLEADFDTIKGIASWKYSTLDPATGEPTEDPDGGFLPPNTTSPQGEGFVSFTIGLNNSVGHNNNFSSQAKILFDQNPPILTNIFSNTIDTEKPSSSVQSLNATQNSTSFLVEWSGFDNHSGLRNYSIFVSVNDSAYKPWIINTAATSQLFQGKAGLSYKFYSIATDSLGNTEDMPGMADAQTTVSSVINNSLDVDGKDPNSIRIFPNPVTDVADIRIELLRNSTVAIQISDITGKWIEESYSGSLSAGTQQIRLNTSSLPGGFYLVHVKVNDTNYTRKIFVLRK